MIKKFKFCFLFIFLIELISFSGFFYPQIREISFLATSIITLLLAVHKLEYGLYMVLAELFIGSKGYLLFFEYEGIQVSLRIGLFLVLMSAWLGKAILKWASTKGDIEDEVESYIVKSKQVFKDFRDFKNLKDKLINEAVKKKSSGNILTFYFLLFIFIAWGIINGWLQGNSFNNIFFDFNAWVYFGLIFPVIFIWQENKNKLDRIYQGILTVFTAAAIWLSVKTLLLLYIFSHKFGFIEQVYLWIRTSGVGEITNTEYGFSRIFFQSHVYIAIAIFVFLALALYFLINKKYKEFFFSHAILLLSISTIIISLSRSFWAGLVVGLLFYFAILIIFFWREWRAILWQIILLIVTAALSVGLIYGIVKFPYPEPIGNFSANLISERASTLNDAAGSSRWNLLPVLNEEIKKNPLQGRGFGATVTYVTQDPRVLEQNPSGEYTTYAFEWGWHDIALKIGGLGLLVYVLLIGKIFIDGVKGIRNYELRITKLTTIALLSGLVMIVVTSIFSPYLNHPLGIGYLVLVSIIISSQGKRKAS